MVIPKSITQLRIPQNFMDDRLCLDSSTDKLKGVYFCSDYLAKKLALNIVFRMKYYGRNYECRGKL